MDKSERKEEDTYVPWRRENIFQREKVTERIIGRNEIRRTTANWKNWRDTVRDRGRDIADRIYHERGQREESVYLWEMKVLVHFRRPKIRPF